MTAGMQHGHILRDKEFYQIVDDLLAYHHNHQLDWKLKEAARSVTIIRLESLKVIVSSTGTASQISGVLKKSALIRVVCSLGDTSELAKNLDWCNVDKRRVKVDELEEEHLEGEAAFKIWLSSWLLPIDKPGSNILIHLLSYIMLYW